MLCSEGDLWVDADVFEGAATTARSTVEPAAYRAALDLYAGDLLPEDLYEAWAQDRRENLRQLYLALLLGLAKLQEAGNEYGPAIDSLRRAAAEEPTLEVAHAGLIRLHALSGSPDQAIVQYDRFRDILARSLGTEPAEATRRLRDEIATGVFSPSTSDGLRAKKGTGFRRHAQPARPEDQFRRTRAGDSRDQAIRVNDAASYPHRYGRIGQDAPRPGGGT